LIELMNMSNAVASAKSPAGAASNELATPASPEYEDHRQVALLDKAFAVRLTEPGGEFQSISRVSPPLVFDDLIKLHSRPENADR